MTTTTREENGVLTVAVEGRVDTGTAPQLDTELRTVMEGTQHLVLDLKDALTVEAVPKKLEHVLAFVDERLEALACPLKTQTLIDLAVDEIFSNIANYAYSPQTGQVTVCFRELTSPPAAEIVFIDSGVPYNPLEKEDPDVTLELEDRPIGGLGIYLVKKTMDAVRYEYVNGQNTLHIVKAL